MENSEKIKHQKKLTDFVERFDERLREVKKVMGVEDLPVFFKKINDKEIELKRQLTDCYDDGLKEEIKADLDRTITYYEIKATFEVQLWKRDGHGPIALQPLELQYYLYSH